MWWVKGKTPADMAETVYKCTWTYKIKIYYMYMHVHVHVQLSHGLSGHT